MRRFSTDVLFTLRIVFDAVLICSLLPVLKFPRLLRLIESRKREIRMAESEIRHRMDLIHKVIRFKYFLIRNNCLRRNLLLYGFLVRAGVKDLRIHIGISKTDAKLEGHCWLSVKGSVVEDTEENTSQYTVIYSSGV